MELAGVAGQREEILARRDRRIWRWMEFLPIADPAHIMSLGEGGTPLVRSVALCHAAGLERLFIKNDGLLPTGSLKDRSNSVGISKAKEWKVQTTAVVSTGNAAASVAAYSAAAGMRAVVIVPESTAPEKVAQAATYGATIVRFRGTFEQAHTLYRDCLKTFGWYDCLSSNPFRLEGKKTYAFEVWQDLGEVPDWTFHPTSGGTGLAATWKGFRELQALGWTQALPRLGLVQAAAAAPIVQAFERNLEEIPAVKAGDTVAESIKVGRPSSMAWRALKAVRESGGRCVAVTDEEILRAQALLAQTAGILGEPTGAASLAAAIKLRQEGVLRPTDLVVCMMTGHGLKQPATLAHHFRLPDPIEPTLAALERLLRP
jgi:threonine synthase